MIWDLGVPWFLETPKWVTIVEQVAPRPRQWQVAKGNLKKISPTGKGATSGVLVQQATRNLSFSMDPAWSIQAIISTQIIQIWLIEAGSTKEQTFACCKICKNIVPFGWEMCRNGDQRSPGRVMLADDILQRVMVGNWWMPRNDHLEYLLHRKIRPESMCHFRIQTRQNWDYKQEMTLVDITLAGNQKLMTHEFFGRQSVLRACDS